jgi:hypothetical protein
LSKEVMTPRNRFRSKITASASKLSGTVARAKTFCCFEIVRIVLPLLIERP